MQQVTNEVVLGFRKSINANQRNEIVARVSGNNGVRTARFSQYAGNMMVIDYDPSVVKAQTIKQSVDNYFETDGPACCLIGM